MVRRSGRVTSPVIKNEVLAAGLRPGDVGRAALFQLRLSEFFSGKVGQEEEILSQAGRLIDDTFAPHTWFIALSGATSHFQVHHGSRLRDEDLRAVTDFLRRLLDSGIETVSARFFQSFEFLSGLPTLIGKSPADSDIRLLILLFGPRKGCVRLADRMLPVLERTLRFRVDNFRLKTDVERRMTALAALHKSAAGLSRQLLKVSDLLQGVCEEAVRTLSVAASAVLMPIDEGRTTFAAQARSGFATDVLPLSDAVLAKAMEDCELTGSKAVIYPGRDGGTSLVAPLTERRKPAKLLLFHENRPGVPLLPETIQVAEIFADWVSIALDNAIMFERVSNSQREWENTFDSISDPIYIVDQDFHLRRMNKTLAALAMRSIKLTEEPSCYRHLFYRSTICPWCPVPRSVRSGAPVSVQTPLFSGGTWQVQSFPWSDKSGRRVGSINILRDLTPMLQMQEQLIESEKMASTGKLISGVAHEVRNPLFGISTTVRALANELGNKENIKPFLEIITSETGRLNQLMEDLLTYSRPVKIDKEACCMEEIINDVFHLVRSQPGGQSVRMELFASTQVPSLNVDRNKMQQVLLNLFQNSMQHSRGETRIEVFVEFLSLSDPPEIQLVVKDNGEGIPADRLPKIFDPFYTTRQRGTGLGLPIVRKVVHDHGGRISVESHTGVGTTFRISLPVTGAHS